MNRKNIAARKGSANRKGSAAKGTAARKGTAKRKGTAQKKPEAAAAAKPTIQPTEDDPSCLDFLRMPKGMLDPIYDQEALEGHANRDAASFLRCHETCVRKACRRAGACIASDLTRGVACCDSPRWDGAAVLLSVYLWVHSVNMKERHRSWAIARDFGRDLVAGDPLEGLNDDGDEPE